MHSLYVEGKGMEQEKMKTVNRRHWKVHDVVSKTKIYKSESIHLLCVKNEIF